VLDVAEGSVWSVGKHVPKAPPRKVALRVLRLFFGSSGVFTASRSGITSLNGSGMRGSGFEF
jgi:hypothetical protein